MKNLLQKLPEPTGFTLTVGALILFLVLFIFNAFFQIKLTELDAQIATMRQELDEMKQVPYQQTLTPEITTVPCYPLTKYERTIIERVVAAETIGEPYAGQMAVSQCIYDACEKDGIRPLEVISKYKYAKSRKVPSSSIIQAVSEVFDTGEMVSAKPIVYFYAPDRIKSKWHERQTFVCEIGGHRFFE